MRSHAGDGRLRRRGHRFYQGQGARKVAFMCLIAAPEGIEVLRIGIRTWISILRQKTAISTITHT
jgi:hypothetical protein